MFILDSNEVKSAMYAKGFKVDIYIELWHKRSAISTFKSSRRCNPKEASSDSLHLKKRKSMEYVKHANSTSNIGTRSRKRRMRAKAYWMQSTLMCGDPYKRRHLEDADTMSRSLTTSLDTPGFTRCTTRSKFLHNFKSSKVESKTKHVDMSSAFKWTEEKSISLTNFQPVFDKKEFS